MRALTPLQRDFALLLDAQSAGILAHLFNLCAPGSPPHRYGARRFLRSPPAGETEASAAADLEDSVHRGDSVAALRVLVRCSDGAARFHARDCEYSWCWRSDLLVPRIFLSFQLSPINDPSSASWVSTAGSVLCTAAAEPERLGMLELLLHFLPRSCIKVRVCVSSILARLGVFFSKLCTRRPPDSEYAHCSHKAHDAAGLTPLHHAAKASNTDGVVALLLRGADAAEASFQNNRLFSWLSAWAVCLVFLPYSYRATPDFANFSRLLRAERPSRSHSSAAHPAPGFLQLKRRRRSFHPEDALQQPHSRRHRWHARGSRGHFS